MTRLEDKVALVTGGTRGVGRGIASELGAAGATVYLTGRSTEGPHGVGAAAAAVTAAGGKGVGVRCDHADDAQVAALFERIDSEAGRLDVLVNCAASIPSTAADYASSFGPFWEGAPSAWDTWCDVGLRSHYAASIFGARMMVARGKGVIVNVSSAAASRYFMSVPYGVGKAALDRFTADAAIQLGEHGIAVVSIWPGAVRTEKTEELERSGLTSLADAESPEFAGRAVVALAGDGEVLGRSGSAFFVAELARDYGFTELDGSQPPLPTYGGMLQ